MHRIFNAYGRWCAFCMGGSWVPPTFFRRSIGDHAQLSPTPIGDHVQLFPDHAQLRPRPKTPRTWTFRRHYAQLVEGLQFHLREPFAATTQGPQLHVRDLFAVTVRNFPRVPATRYEALHSLLTLSSHCWITCRMPNIYRLSNGCPGNTVSATMFSRFMFTDQLPSGRELFVPLTKCGQQ